MFRIIALNQHKIPNNKTYKSRESEFHFLFIFKSSDKAHDFDTRLCGLKQTIFITGNRNTLFITVNRKTTN